jgi:hypothetical protein
LSQLVIFTCCLLTKTTTNQLELTGKIHKSD